MKKQIRLLIENLFDDIYDIDQGTDLSVEIADEHLKYNYFPKNFNELRNLLTKLLKERGKDADLNDIDVSQVTTFYNENIDLGLFEKLNPHNIDIKYWDVSNVTDMAGTFCFCKNFNCNLRNWNVRQVEDMRWMFDSCENFTGEGLENWKPINCKDMKYMFKGCINFNCNLGNWNVRQIEDMQAMFDDCNNFTGEGLENWEPINCKKMWHMFDECTSLKNKPSWYKE